MSCLCLFLQEAWLLVVTVASPSTEEPVRVASTTLTIVLESCALQELNNMDRNVRITKDWMSNALAPQFGYAFPILSILKASVASETFAKQMVDGGQ